MTVRAKHSTFRMSKFLPLLFIVLTLPGLAAQSQSIPYDLDHPVLATELAQELAEISGLSLATDGTGELLAVQDELGKVYRLSAGAGTVLWSTDFWKEGDYEGIEAVGEDVWVTKNTGTLYQIQRIGAPDQHVNKFNTALTGDNDVEGLAYDPINHLLLLACKDDVRDDGNDKDGRYVFAFDLKTNTLGKEPRYAVTQEDINLFLGGCPDTRDYDKLRKFFGDDDFNLSPSALAIDSRTGHLYMASSRGNALVVLDDAGRVIHLHRFDKKYLPQAEGLAFGNDGTLYISTEARGERGGRIYHFERR